MNLRPVIVGGGSAGMAAAIELARRGVPCVLFDEASRPGGVVYRGPLRAGVDPAYLGARYTRMLEKLRRDFSACAGHIDLRLNSRVVGGDGQHLMVLDEAERLHEVEYSHLLLATGCHERSVPFPDWTLPGVMLLGGLQLQIKSGVVKPLGDTLITGSGPLLPLVACQLHAAGVRVAGVYEACAFGRMARESLALLNKPQLFLDGLSMLGYLKLNGIPLHYGWGVVEASGEGELTEVTVAPYDEEWRPDLENARPVKASTLAVGYGFIPRTQLSQQLGLEHGFSDDGYLRAECNVWQQSSQPHIHLAGDMAGIRGGEAAMIGGRIAALSILLQREAIAPAEAIERRESHLARLEAIKRFRAGVERYTQRGARQVELARADTVICRCEQVTRGDIERARTGRAGHRRAEDAHPRRHGRLPGADVHRLLQRSPAPRHRTPRRRLAAAAFPDRSDPVFRIPEPRYGSLNMNRTYDIVIAGGGVIGASCAYQLSRRGNLRIAVVDDKRPGNATRASAGGLWAIGESVGLGCGVIFFRMMSSRNRREAQGAAVAVDASTPHILPPAFFDLALQSNALYPELHRELIERHGMDFKFERTGLKYVIQDDEDRQYAEHIVAQIPHLAEQVRWLDREELRRAEPAVSHAAHGALEFLCDHQVSPFRLADAYLEAARQNGVELLPGTNVTGVLRQGRRISGVRTDNAGVLHCRTLINAAGAWAAELSEMATGRRIPVKPVKGQIVLTERMPRLLNGCLTTSDCYMAQKDNGEILIGSTTEDKGFDVSNTFPEIAGLVQGAVRCVPELQQVNLKRTWAGLRPGSPDELPILGPVAEVEGYLNACGHFRTGILTSAITGVLLDRLVHEETLPLDIAPFLAARFQPEPAAVAVAAC